MLFIIACTNYANLGMPRGINGHIMHVNIGYTTFAYVQSMYGQPKTITPFPDGSSNALWILDTSAGDCLVEMGFTPTGTVNWYNYTYKNAVKRRN